jgi:hypothetical protein
MPDMINGSSSKDIHPNVRCWWTLDPAPGNMGDILTPLVLAAYGHTVTRVLREEIDWLFIGSTIRFARPGVRVVGTGVIDRKDRIEPRAHYLAVRGPLTADLVRRAGGNPPPVLGDPALLLPRFHCPDVNPINDIGFIPHYIDHGDPQVASWSGTMINVLRNNPLDVVAEIRQCRAIFSSSLHGIIVAHAYGIPAAWIRLGNRLDGDDVKFADYAASVDIDLIPYSSLAEAEPVLPKAIDTGPLHQLFVSLGSLR